MSAHLVLPVSDNLSPLAPYSTYPAHDCAIIAKLHAVADDDWVRAVVVMPAYRGRLTFLHRRLLKH